MFAARALLLRHFMPSVLYPYRKKSYLYTGLEHVRWVLIKKQAQKQASKQASLSRRDEGSAMAEAT
jgi:hypothetical protein